MSGVRTSAYAHETIQSISNYLTLHCKYKAKVPPIWFIHSKNLPFFLTFIYLFLAVLGLSCLTCAFSSHSKEGLLSSCGARASHYGSLSYCGVGALGQRLNIRGAWA